MNTRASIWLLGLLGAASGMYADVLCVRAVQTGAGAGPIVAASCIFALSAPLWYCMACLTRGSFIEGIIVWSTAAAVFSVVAVILCDGRQTFRSWLGFGLIILGVLVRR